MNSFAGQNAIITGASSGVGKAIAIALAARGASLGLVGRDQKALEAVVPRTQMTSSRIVCYRADLERKEDLKQLILNIKRDWTTIDLLLHSAGAFSMGKHEKATLEDFDSLYSVNVRAPYSLTQSLLERLRPKKGQIVFINSSGGINARAQVGQYDATKHALKAVANSLRDEINHEGLRVLSVYLGRTASRMQVLVHQLEGKSYRPELLIQPEDVASTVIHLLDLPRTVEVTDISMRPLQKT